MRTTAKNKDYWQKRMAALEDKQYQQGAAYYKDVQRQYIRATNSIQMDIMQWYQRLADNNDISYAGAKKLLKKNELEEFKWTVEDYIKAGEENAVNQRWMKELENASARHHISYLEAMKIQMQQHTELLSTEFEGGITDYLHKAYGEQYYHTAYEAARGTGVGSNLAKLDTRKVDAVIKKPWAQDGANFSDRIWTNKDKLVRNLHTELTQNIIRGASPQKAIDSLSKTMEVSRSQAGRLIMTESAAIASAAQKDCLKDLGVERYEILATLDNQTSQICRDMDGRVFDMKDYKVGETAPPFHPNCRSTTVPYFDDEFTAGEERAARDGDGKTYYVPADMKYKEWEKQFVKDAVDKSEINVYNMPKGVDLSDWKRKQFPTTSEEDAVLSNINYRKSDGYRYNCQRCVPAYEMRRRGYDVTAKPAILDGRDSMQDDWSNVFENANWEQYKTGSGLEAVEERMKQFGDGARAEIQVVWENGTDAHVFVAEQRAGRTVFIDPQTGEADVREYFAYAKPGETRLCRMDNLNFTELIEECCEEYKYHD